MLIKYSYEIDIANRSRWPDVQINGSDAMTLDGACVEEIEAEGRLLACERGALMKFLSAGRGASERKRGRGSAGRR